MGAEPKINRIGDEDVFSSKRYTQIPVPLNVESEEVPMSEKSAKPSLEEVLQDNLDSVNNLNNDELNPKHMILLVITKLSLTLKKHGYTDQASKLPDNHEDTEEYIKKFLEETSKSEAKNIKITLLKFFKQICESLGVENIAKKCQKAILNEIKEELKKAAKEVVNNVTKITTKEMPEGPLKTPNTPNTHSISIR